MVAWLACLTPAGIGHLSGNYGSGEAVWWLHGWSGRALHLARTTCLLGRRSRHLFHDVSVCTCLSVFSDVYLGGGVRVEGVGVGGGGGWPHILQGL